ncbi:hypothetical protein [Pseudonocardia xinjiangensis]|uniref:Uncharacterized protein n=1 Tax=Pseudonocardia xinjiangensis TaxID=75289 RepID=A0ABX1R958_9PSEU|nr:hypothetical protein [Pseudonocardia xinjiangensis]NMH76404.1 hypothetical protein [Pseudonocardia xinjiangensis]
MDRTDDVLRRHADRIEGYGRSLVDAAARMRDAGGRDQAQMLPSDPSEQACWDAFRAELDDAERLPDEAAREEARQLAGINLSMCLIRVPPPGPIEPPGL